MVPRFPPDDTSAEARVIVTAAYARMSPAEKIARIRDLTLMADRLALAGLRSRYPEEPEGELLLRLAEVRLGAALTRQIYGRLPSDP